MPEAVPFIGGMIGATAPTLGTAAFGAYVAGAGFSSWLTTSFVGRLLTGVAISALRAALTPKPQRPGIKTTSTAGGGTNPLSFILGKYATGGTMVCPAMSHSRPGKNKNYYLTYVIELGDIPGKTLEGLSIDGNLVEIGTPAEAHADYGLPIKGDYDGYAWVKYYDGSQTVADPMLLAKYAAYPDRPWSADMVGAGLCYAILTFRYNREIFNNLPQVRFVMGGIPLYDPRKDSTVGGTGTHRWADRSTWEPSENTVVQIYNIMRGIELPGLGTWGGGVDVDALPIANWFAGMNNCDVDIALADGGSEPQYRSSLEVTVDEEPAAVIEELLKGCSGKMAEVAGVWKIRVGAPGLPVHFFTDGNILVNKTQELEPFPGLSQTYNAVLASHPDPDSNWEAHDAPGLFSAELEAEDQGKRLAATLSLPAVPYGKQVQRIMRAYWNDQRRFRRHVLSLTMAAAVLEPLDVAAWTSAANGYDVKSFEIGRIADHLRSGAQRPAMREVDPDDYNWSSANELPTSAAPSGWTKPDPQPVEGWDVIAVTIDDAGSNARRPGLKLVWDGDLSDTAKGIRWEIRLAGTAEVVLRGSTQDVSAGDCTVTEGILPATDYEGHAQLILDAPTEWSLWEPATTDDVRLGTADIASQVTDLITAAQATADASAARAEEVLTEASGLVDALSAGTDAAIAGVLEDLANVEAELGGRAAASFERIAEMLLSARLDLAGVTSRMADAGIIVDPETGKVSIEAVSRIDDELGTVQADFNAALASIELRATYTDVAFAIAEAQLGPENMPILTNFDGRLSTAEADIDALEGAITLKADTLVVDGLSVTLTQAVADIDSLEAEIALRATQTQVDALAQDVTDAQLALAAYDGAQFRLSLTDIYRAHQGLEEQALADLAALLGQHEAGEVQRTDLAYLRQDMVALVDEDRQSIASLRTELGVSYDSAVALVVQEASARASADAAEAAARQSLAVTVADAEAAILTETQARIAADAAEATAREALAVSVGDNQAAITAEAQARTDADQAAAVRADTIEANIGSISAVVVQNATAVSTLNGYAAATYTLRVAVDGAETGLEAVTANDPVNGPTADLRLFGRMIRLDGNVSVDGTFFTGTLLATEAWIRRAMIGDAEVDTLKVAGQAITVDFNASRNVQVGDTGYTSASDPWYDYMSFTIDLAKDAQSVSVDADLVMLVNSSARWSFRIIRSDTQGVLHSIGGDVAQQAFHLRGDIGALGKGLRTFILQYRLGVGLGIQNAKMSVGVKYR